MLGNSYPNAGGPLSQSQVQAGNSLSSMGILNDVNSNDSSPFDINDFPQLTGRPSSAGGPQGQLGIENVNLHLVPLLSWYGNWTSVDNHVCRFTAKAKCWC